ncbi:MAG: hypothetical protein GY941_22490 [Planctomycetes bacterium]|nr:hypothetical protein [Planctomycetota bacterium]
MSRIDIRKETDDITEIQYKDTETVCWVDDARVNLSEEDGSYWDIAISDLDNLIKALQKAKELWG